MVSKQAEWPSADYLITLVWSLVGKLEALSLVFMMTCVFN